MNHVLFAHVSLMSHSCLNNCSHMVHSCLTHGLPALSSPLFCPSRKVKGWALDMACESDQRLTLQVMIKAADVSNPAKSTGLYLYWTTRILEEFYAQGDEEAKLGMAVTAMPACDRAKPSVSGGQKGFIGFVVKASGHTSFPTAACLASGHTSFPNRRLSGNPCALLPPPPPFFNPSTPLQSAQFHTPNLGYIS